MATPYTTRPVVTTDYTVRPSFTKWIDYFRFNDWVSDNIFCDNEWNRITFISKSWFEPIDYWTQYTTRPVI